MAVPVWSDRGGMISCTEALARGGDEALTLFSEDCHLESCTPTLQSGSLILWASLWAVQEGEGELSPLPDAAPQIASRSAILHRLVSASLTSSD